jgi:hypothetical protein
VRNCLPTTYRYERFCGNMRAGRPVDAGYWQYRRAKQLDGAAIVGPKTDYDEGCIRAVRFLDAVNPYNKLAPEADSTSDFDISIAALGAAKGVLLGDRLILVIDRLLLSPVIRRRRFRGERVGQARPVTRRCCRAGAQTVAH